MKRSKVRLSLRRYILNVRPLSCNAWKTNGMQIGSLMQDLERYKSEHDSGQPGPLGAVGFTDAHYSPSQTDSQHSGSVALAFMSLASPPSNTLACTEACVQSDSSAGEETNILDCSDQSALVPLETPDVLRCVLILVLSACKMSNEMP